MKANCIRKIICAAPFALVFIIFPITHSDGGINLKADPLSKKEISLEEYSALWQKYFSILTKLDVSSIGDKLTGTALMKLSGLDEIQLREDFTKIYKFEKKRLPRRSVDMDFSRPIEEIELDSIQTSLLKVDIANFQNLVRMFHGADFLTSIHEYEILANVPSDQCDEKLKGDLINCAGWLPLGWIGMFGFVACNGLAINDYHHCRSAFQR